MKYQQRPLFEDALVTKRAWKDMGHRLLICPGCNDLLSYPANVISYAVVCACGWGALPAGDGTVVWVHPLVTDDLIVARFWSTNSNN